MVVPGVAATGATATGATATGATATGATMPVTAVVATALRTSVLVAVALGALVPVAMALSMPALVAMALGATVLVAMALGSSSGSSGVLSQLAYPDLEHSIFMPVAMMTANSSNDLAILQGVFDRLIIPVKCFTFAVCQAPAIGRSGEESVPPVFFLIVMDTLHPHKERVSCPAIPLLILIQYIGRLLGVPGIGVLGCVLCRAGSTLETPHPVLGPVVVLALKHRHPLSWSAEAILGLVQLVLVATVDICVSNGNNGVASGLTGCCVGLLNLHSLATMLVHHTSPFCHLCSIEESSIHCRREAETPLMVNIHAANKPPAENRKYEISYLKILLPYLLGFLSRFTDVFNVFSAFCCPLITRTVTPLFRKLLFAMPFLLPE